MKSTKSKLIEKVATKKVLKQNEEAIKSYDRYKETTDLIDRADIALGRICLQVSYWLNA